MRTVPPINTVCELLGEDKLVLKDSNGDAIRFVVSSVGYDHDHDRWVFGVTLGGQPYRADVRLHELHVVAP